MGDFNIVWDLLTTKGLDKAEFIRCIQERFLNQYVNSLTRGRAIQDWVFRNELGKMPDLSVGEQLRNSDYNFLSFEIAIGKDKYGICWRVQNGRRANKYFIK